MAEGEIPDLLRARGQRKAHDLGIVGLPAAGFNIESHERRASQTLDQSREIVGIVQDADGWR